MCLCHYLLGMSWLLVAGAARAQAPADTLSTAALPSALRVTSAIDSAGACTEVLSWGTAAALVRTFHPTGQLHQYLPFAQLALGVRHGTSSAWYATGQAECLEPYEHGQREGTLLLFYEDGQLKRQARYQAGREQSSRCYDAQGQPVPYFPYEQAPLYPGGLARLNQEINQRLRRTPALSRVVVAAPIILSVSFLVNTDGRLSELRLDVPTHWPALDQAVLRAVQQLSRPWQPGRRDGQPFTFRYRLPVEFRPPTAYRAGPRL
ncbi:MAG: TonB family protein [Janthinobacterium lividum]